MTLYLRNKTWYYDFWYQGRRHRKAVGKDRRLAEKAETIAKAKTMQAAIEETYGLSVKKFPKFNQFAQQYLEYSKANKKSWQRDRFAIQNFLKYFSNYYLNQITPWLIEKFKLERAKCVKPISVNRDLACLKNMYTMAIKWKKATSNPVKEVNMFKVNVRRERVLNYEEEGKLLEKAEDPLKAIIEFALNTGMRYSEILNLTWEDVNLESKVAIIKDTKSNRTRYIPLNEIAINTIKRMKDLQFKINPDRVFDRQDVQVSWRKLANACGLYDFRFHDLRHTFATRLKDTMADIVTIKELLGHSSLEMTQRYSHTSETLKRTAVENLSHKIPHARNISAYKLMN